MARTPARLLLYSLRTSITLLRLPQKERGRMLRSCAKSVIRGDNASRCAPTLPLPLYPGRSEKPAAQSFSATLARMIIKSRLETGQPDQRPRSHQCKSILPSREPDLRTQPQEPRAECRQPSHCPPPESPVCWYFCSRLFTAASLSAFTFCHCARTLSRDARSSWDAATMVLAGSASPSSTIVTSRVNSRLSAPNPGASSVPVSKESRSFSKALRASPASFAAVFCTKAFCRCTTSFLMAVTSLYRL